MQENSSAQAAPAAADGRVRHEMVVKIPLLMLLALRGYFQVIGRVLPAVAARTFQTMMSRLPRKRPGKRDLAFLAQARRRDFDCGDVVLAGYEMGEGPTVLLVHGLLGNAGNYQELAPRLVQGGYRVVAFDCLNHGQSPDGVAFSNATIRHLRQVIGHMGDLHAVVSHSAGSYLTMMSLLDFPADRTLGRCVYLAPYPDILTTMHTFTDHFRVPRSLEPRIRLWFDEIGGMPVDDQSFVRCLPRHRTPAPPPSLFVHCRDDHHIALANTERVVASAGNAQLHVTQGLGHFRILKDSAVIGRILAFLDEPGHGAAGEHGAPAARADSRITLS